MGLRDHIVYRVADQKPCDEFGSCAVLYRYPEPTQECGKDVDRGCPVTYDITIDIQPSTNETAGEKIMITPEGHRAESNYEFYYNPHHPDNLAVNNGQPLFLVTSDSRFNVDGFDSSILKHSDVIEWLGEKFMVCELQNWGGETCLDDGCNKISHQEGEIGAWADNYQERNATIDNDTFAYDGDLQ